MAPAEISVTRNSKLETQMKEPLVETSGSQPSETTLRIYPPTNLGGLFSIKAATPSLKSFVNPD